MEAHGQAEKEDDEMTIERVAIAGKLWDVERDFQLAGPLRSPEGEAAFDALKRAEEVVESERNDIPGDGPRVEERGGDLFVFGPRIVAGPFEEEGE